jgi:hypothetical protein
LKLAAAEGLISEQDLKMPSILIPQNLYPEPVLQAKYAQRQEFGAWLAKTMKLEPVYGQDKILTHLPMVSGGSYQNSIFGGGFKK